MLSLYVATLLAVVCQVNAQMSGMVSRHKQMCAYMNNKIYCYGGFTTALDVTPNKYDPLLYAIDIANLDGQSSVNIPGYGYPVSLNGIFDPEKRIYCGITVLPDGETMLFQGGLNTAIVNNQTSLVNETIGFNSSSAQWIKYPDFITDDAWKRQIYWSTAVNFPDNDTIAFNGGRDQVVSSTATDDYRYRAFNPMALFKISTQTWTVADAPADFNPYAQAATIDRKGVIYYVGGQYYTGPTSTQKSNYLSWAYTFNTQTSTWTNMTFGNAPAGSFYLHTATMMPNSNDILIFGGATGSPMAARPDFCYTLNLDTKLWTPQYNKLNLLSMDAPRFLHSATLVNSTLYILFGVNTAGLLVSNSLALDVSNVSNITYSPTINAQYTPPTLTTHLPDEPGSSVGLSTGAIAGIGAGSAIAGLLILIALFIYIRRIRAKKSQEIDVDWDKIDEHYREVDLPISQSHQEEKGALIDHDLARVVPDGQSPSSGNSFTTDATTVTSSPVQQRTLPDFVVQSTVPDVALRSVKPDGGH